MKLDRLPVEILQTIFAYLDTDLLSLDLTSERVHDVAAYERLWQPLVDRLNRRIQNCGSPQSFRQYFLKQQRINRHVGQLLDDYVSTKNMDCLQQILDYGINARDKLLQVLDQTKPGTIPSTAQYNIAHNFWAGRLLMVIRQQVAIKELQPMADTPHKYDITDFFTALDGFHDSHVLNPDKQDIFEDIMQEMTDVKVRGSVEQKAVAIAEKVFCTSKQKNQHKARNFLSAVLEDGMPGNDTVNICIYSYIAKLFGLEISPVLLEQRGRHVSSNFARVEDSSKRDGFFIINTINQLVLSPQALGEMVQQQRSVRLVTTQPALHQIVTANATRKASIHDLISENAYWCNAMAKLVTVTLFNNDDQVWRLAASDPRFSQVTRADVDDLMDGKFPKCYLPEYVQPCREQGQVVQRIHGHSAVVLGFEPSRQQYKVMDETGLTWYITKDELKSKHRVMLKGHDLACKPASSLYTETLGQCFVGYDDKTCSFIA